MNNEIESYNERLINCKTQQPRHLNDINQYDSTLKKLGFYSSYDGNISRECFDELEKIPSFLNGSLGLKAKPNRSEYFYHYTTLNKFLKKIPGWFNDLSKHGPVIKLFNDLLNISNKNVGKWLKLGDFADGNYEAYRKLNWWTTNDLMVDDILSNLYKIGIPNDWIREFSIIVRIRQKEISKLTEIKVPTALDAYFSPVFYTTDDDRNPNTGSAIDLKEINKLKLGSDEYIIQNVPVQFIEFIPVCIEEIKKQKDQNLGYQLMWNLLYFYKNINNI